MKLGFIGLGIMGAPMALHLVNAGNQLFVNTRGKVREDVAASAAVTCKNAEEVTREAEVIFIMVPDTPDVLKPFCSGPVVSPPPCKATPAHRARWWST